jgi:hypothetical protein
MALASFPVPYRDELLFSIIARFADRVRFPGDGTVADEFFGTN